jgi:Ca-activated chloride channel family protein
MISGISRRKRAAAQAPPALPQAAPMTRVQEMIEQAVPYLIPAVLGLPIIAVAVYYIQKSGAELVFAQPQGEWISSLRTFLLWAVLPLAVLGLAVWVSLTLSGKRAATIRFSRTRDVASLGRGIRSKLLALPNALRILALGSFLFALAGPQLKRTSELAEEAKGIDIMIALDVSGSMSARDLNPNRLEAAKRVIDDFINRRKRDRIGLVLFAKEAYWWCPLTTDHSALRTMLSGVRLGVVNPRGTAIGDGIGTSLNRLRRSKTKSKIIILLTDGDNNSGMIMPRKAASYARTLKVKVYTILMGYEGGRGRRGRNIFPFRPRYPVNPRLLEEIAATTGGTPYLAGDEAALKDRFQKILNSLKKSKLKARTRVRRTSIHQPFLGLGLGLLLLEVLLALTIMRRFP